MRCATRATHPTLRRSLAALSVVAAWPAAALRASLARLPARPVQGLQLGRAQLGELLAQASNCAAFHSLVVGELPGCPDRGDAENLLAECGLLGALCVPGEGDAGSVVGSAQPHVRWDAAQWGQPGGEGRWLFGAQQLRLSLEQMGIYQRHVDAQVEEDFGDAHFS